MYIDAELTPGNSTESYLHAYWNKRDHNLAPRASTRGERRLLYLLDNGGNSCYKEII